MRINDSRPASQVGAYATPWGPGATRTVTVAGTHGIPTNAHAVALNITVTDTTAPSYLTVWPTGTPQPGASTLDWAPGQTLANAATATVGTNGQINLYNYTGNTNVIVDITGWYDTNDGDTYHALTPARVNDSRPDSQIGPYTTPWATNTTRTVTVAGTHGIPTNAHAVALNITVTDTTAPSYLTVWPTGTPQPGASTLDWAPGQTLANAATATVGTNGQINLYNYTGNTNVIVDITGWYDTNDGDTYHALTPARVNDSRPDSQIGPYTTPWATNTTRTVTVAGTHGIPTNAHAVALNITVTDTTAPSYLTVWPTGTPQPGASTLDWAPGQTLANAATATVGTNGQINLYNYTGNTNVIVDIVGWYSP